MHAPGWDRRTELNWRQRWAEVKPVESRGRDRFLKTERATNRLPAVRLAESIHLAMEKLVLFLAGRSVTPYCTADQCRNTQRDDHRRKVAAQMCEMRNQIVHIQEPHFVPTR
jgi:hypothetical protein